MDAMESLARSVAKRFSGFATQITKPTIALDAKLVEKFLPIAVCPGYCDRTGRVRSKRLSLSSVARDEHLLIDNPRFVAYSEVGVRTLGRLHLAIALQLKAQQFGLSTKDSRVGHCRRPEGSVR
jgi:hypothetical protein